MTLSSHSAATRQSRKRLQTSEHIAAVAFDLFEEHGYDNVGMEQIAVAADVAKGTLYNHFPVKEALVRYRFHADLADNLPALLQDLGSELGCEPRLRAFFRHVATYSKGQREYLPHYLKYRLSQSCGAEYVAERSGMVDVIKVILEDGKKDGAIESCYSVDSLSESAQFMFFTTLMLWLRIPDDDLLIACDKMLDLFLHGCATQVRA